MKKLRSTALVAWLWSSSAAALAPDVREQWEPFAEPLARILVAEGDASVSDWQAMLWTLEHRRAESDAPAGAILSYSATLRQKTERVREIYAAEPGPRRARQLASARLFVAQWLSGEVRDPCPESRHWHGMSDHRPAWFRVVWCGPTRNTFGASVTR